MTDYKEFAEKTAVLLKLAEVEIPLISQQIVFSSRRCLEASILALGCDDKKFQAIRKSVHAKAWEIFKEKHPTPWIKQ